MKLNPDCVRDVLLQLEESTGVGFDNMGTLILRPVSPKLLPKTKLLNGKYSFEEIAYTLIQLADAGYIYMEFGENGSWPHLKLGDVFYITSKGHGSACYNP